MKRALSVLPFRASSPVTGFTWVGFRQPRKSRNPQYRLLRRRAATTLNGSNDVDSRKGVPFLALVDIVDHLWDQITQKTQFWGREQGFSFSQFETFILQQVALLWQRDRATRLSVEILQLQNIPFENQSCRSIVWHYLCVPTFSRFRTILECDRHTQTNRRTDRHTTMACIALSIASRGKNRPYCTAHQV